MTEDSISAFGRGPSDYRAFGRLRVGPIKKRRPYKALYELAMQDN